jgi:hypothetical protein
VIVGAPASRRSFDIKPAQEIEQPAMQLSRVRRGRPARQRLDAPQRGRFRRADQQVLAFVSEAGDDLDGIDPPSTID